MSRQRAGSRGPQRGAASSAAPRPGSRPFDLILAVSGMVALSPLFAIIALLVKWSSPGPVFFKADRVGRDGRLFKVLKFRTMEVGAHAAGPMITRAGDPRITAVGHWLRRTKLDELPQLINVVKGDMAVVGPRPEDPRLATGYTPDQRAVLRVRPGITSPASARYRHEEALLARDGWEQYYRDVVMPDKIRIDLEYLARRTVWSDLRILHATVFSVASLTPDSDRHETGSS